MPLRAAWRGDRPTVRGGVAGYLGDQFNPFVLPGDASNPSFTVRDDLCPAAWTPSDSKRRMKVLETVDTWQAQLESSTPALEAADTFYEKAYNLVTAPSGEKGVRHRPRGPSDP